MDDELVPVEGYEADCEGGGEGEEEGQEGGQATQQGQGGEGPLGGAVHLQQPLMASSFYSVPMITRANTVDQQLPK